MTALALSAIGLLSSTRCCVVSISDFVCSKHAGKQSSSKNVYMQWINVAFQSFAMLALVVRVLPLRWGGGDF